MSAKEVLRLQGLSTQRIINESDSKVRSMAGNAMTVTVVAQLVSSILRCIKGFTEEPNSLACTSRSPLVEDGGCVAEMTEGSSMLPLTGTSAASVNNKDRTETVVEKVCVPSRDFRHFRNILGKGMSSDSKNPTLCPKRYEPDLGRQFPARCETLRPNSEKVST